jgi:hypothetical protein
LIFGVSVRDVGAVVGDDVALSDTYPAGDAEGHDPSSPAQQHISKISYDKPSGVLGDLACYFGVDAVHLSNGHEVNGDVCEFLAEIVQSMASVQVRRDRPYRSVQAGSQGRLTDAAAAFKRQEPVQGGVKITELC